MTKVLVVGGAGFIGSHLVDALIAQGFDVHVVDNLTGGKRERLHAKATLHEVDIREYEKLEPLFQGARFVFHLAALPRVQYSIEHPDVTHEVNITGTLNVLRAAALRKVERVVYSASSSAYGNQKTMPLVESMVPNPLSPYGLQKYVGELYCRVWSEVYGLSTVSLRYFNVYGSRHDPDGPYALVIGKFLKQRKEGGVITITGDGEQTRDFTHVRDVVRANVLAAESTRVGKGEVVNIGAGRPISINTIASLIGGAVEHVAPRLEPRHTQADTQRARELLGWEPTIAIEEGIAELKREYGLL